MLIKRICLAAFDIDDPEQRVEVLVKPEQIKQNFYDILKDGRGDEFGWFLDNVYEIGERLDAFFVYNGELLCVGVEQIPPSSKDAETRTPQEVFLYTVETNKDDVRRRQVHKSFFILDGLLFDYSPEYIIRIALNNLGNLDQYLSDSH